MNRGKHSLQPVNDSNLPEGNVMVRIEYQVNRLASGRIIPSALFSAMLAPYVDVEPITSEILEEIAGKFGVSMMAMEIKLSMI